MDMIAHQAVAVQFKRFALLEVGNGLEKSHIIAFVAKNRLAVVATIDPMIHPSVVDRPQRARHGDNLSDFLLLRKTKIVLTPFSPVVFFDRIGYAIVMDGWLC